jgi:hypothetical protein
MATNKQIQGLRTAAGEAGDIVGAAICQQALYGDGSGYETYDLTDEERAKVDAMTQKQARAWCERVLAGVQGVV